MNKVMSKDGTPVAYQRVGKGPPLVLVPGTAAANPAVWPAAPALADRFTLYAVDRRGHGESGDGPEYSIEREYEDIAAVVDSLAEPAALLGHSFGALCCLEAARLAHNLRRLVLYEPAVPLPGIAIYPDGLVEQVERLLERGEREQALVTFYREVAHLLPAEIEQMRASPAWASRLAGIATLPREARAELAYRFSPEQFREMNTPTLLLLGGNSSQMFNKVAGQVNAALPDSRVAVLAGQEHIAMYTAPELFVQEVVRFLEGS